MATKAQAERVMRNYRLDPARHLDLDPSEPSFAVLDAPVGRFFLTEKTHSVGVGEDRKSDMYDNIISHLQGGLGVCSDGGCEDSSHNQAQTNPNLGRQF